MEYGYCNTTLIPCRLEPSDKAEQINQLLFGDLYQVLETTEKWVLIKTVSDQYESWIDAKLHRPLTEEKIDDLSKDNTTVLATPLITIKETATGFPVHLSYGSTIPRTTNGTFNIGNDAYTFHGPLPPFPAAATLVAFSHSFLNTPYLWGGKSLFGIDCSGFVQVVFRIFGYWLPRDAWQQAEIGETIDFVDLARPGDLAFFGAPEGKITHVGICNGEGGIIHASGRCRIDKLDDKGILNQETGNYSHNLRTIKRVI